MTDITLMSDKELIAYKHQLENDVSFSNNMQMALKILLNIWDNE
jgi:hypothetical protein